MGGTVFVVDDSIDNVLIGSDPSCRFALPDTAVDPIHARLWIDLEGITVYDTNSPRGVYINDDRVQGQARLRNGDILWLGPPGDEQSVMLQCRLPGATGPAAHGRCPPPRPRPMRSPPAIEPTVAMMAIDLDPTVSLVPEPVVTPEPEPAASADDASEESFSLDEPPPEPTVLLAPDAIQPEPTVMHGPGGCVPRARAHGRDAPGRYRVRRASRRRAGADGQPLRPDRGATTDVIHGLGSDARAASPRPPMRPGWRARRRPSPSPCSNPSLSSSLRPIST